MKPLLIVLIHLLFFFCKIPQKSPKESLRSSLAALDCIPGHGPTGELYPDFKLENDTRKVSNQSLKGKVVLINFWFEGCHPCMAEMGALQSLYEKMKHNKDFEFISITWDHKEAINRVKDRFGLTFDVFRASDTECSRLNFGCGYPSNFILDKSGILRFRYHGGSVKIPEAAAFVEKTLLPEIEFLL